MSEIQVRPLFASLKLKVKVFKSVYTPTVRNEFDSYQRAKFLNSLSTKCIFLFCVSPYIFITILFILHCYFFF
jgi:hypothetical protein